VHYAITHHVPPKHLEPTLVMLRDAELLPRTTEDIERLAGEIRDHSFRIFAHQGQIHLLSAGLHLAERDPFLLFEKLLAIQRIDRRLDLSHAFYLGYEMAKAATAITLGKHYEQDESLDWGFLTQAEAKHRLTTQPKGHGDSDGEDGPT
jgi:hypothetical protein